MKNTLIFIVLFWNNCFSQEEKLFKDISIDSSMILVGMYPQYDLEKTYEKYNFYIKNFKTLDSLKNILTYGIKLKQNWHESNSAGINSDFHIKLIKNNTVIKEWTVSPKYYNIMFNGGSYFFDPIILQPLAKKYPFKYSYYSKDFSSKQDYELFYSNLIKDKSFLYIKAPKFEIEGSFEVKFLKSEKFSSPKAIMEYIDSKFKNESTEKYLLYYKANEYNIKNSNQYTITIESSPKFYKIFNDAESSKGSWQPENYSATIFLKE